jgi:hypothetical protein
MRNELHEPGQGLLKSATAGHHPASRPAKDGGRNRALSPPAVDEALADDTTLAAMTPAVSQRGSRRELTAAASDVERRIIDHAHPSGPELPDELGDGALLRRLSQQLCSLASQQDQIRRLLEQAEQYAAAKRSARQ